MGEYNRALIIKYARQRSRLTQNQLSEGICDPVTLARYENGLLNPSAEKYNKIMERLGLSSEQVMFNIQSDYLNIEHELKNILYLFEKREFEKAKTAIEKMKKHDLIPLQYTENRQYIERINLVILYYQKQISVEEYIERLQNLLQLSQIQFNAEYMNKKSIITETEILLLNNLATAYGKNGEFLKANSIFQELVLHFEKDTPVNDCKPWYLVLINFSNLLGQNNKYNESIQICRKGIQWLKEKDQANYLFNFYYNIGWNYAEKYKNEENDLRFLQIAKLFIWEAYQLSLLYPESKEIPNLIKEYFNEIQDLINYNKY